MHRLLKRQLKKYFEKYSISSTSIPVEWQDFLNAVDDAYSQFDADHILIERSLDLSSEELLQANHQLRQLLKTVEGRTDELTRANIELQKALTDLQKAQIHLIQAEKMSSLGQLIAGIAHEINNPVNFIHGNLQYLDQYATNLLTFIELSQQCCSNTTPEMASMAEEIELEFIKTDLPKIINSMEIGTNRIREIVLSLRNFSHMDKAELKLADIHQGIENALLILNHRLRFKSNSQQIQIIKQYGDLPLVNCYPGQLNQVFLNILANAIDALEEYQSGTVIDPTSEELASICIRSNVIDNYINDQHHERYVEITIADNGNGMPESIQQQIFNPFFTTKPVGKGTGMGMAISYQIITERHHGKLTCVSKEGKGTEFIIQIPINSSKSQI